MMFASTKSFSFLLLALWSFVVSAAIKSSDSGSTISVSNDRLAFSVVKTAGTIGSLSLDGQDLLGSGGRLYLDCHCASGFWKAGTATLYKGTDPSGTAWAGVRISAALGSGVVFDTYFFLRDGETGLHSFARVNYPSGGDLGELRFLFRPSSSMWNYLSSSDRLYGPIPTNGPTVQDAAWQITGSSGKNGEYISTISDYFTKYMFSEVWSNHTHHGLYSDGTGTKDGVPYGAWLVMNTKDTYYNGPTHSDLTVDGIAYNYLVSNHHGNGVPQTAGGFDRTFGPSYYYFNKGAKGSTIQQLRDDAGKYADPSWNAAFYDSIAQYVTGYVPTSSRGTWSGQIVLPAGVSNVYAVLASNNRDFQDNNYDTKSYQYWGQVDSKGAITIPRVKAGTYRLTVYGDGVFGQYTQDNVIVTAGATTKTAATWAAESAGTELWRIGTPDKSCGEFRHGNAPDTTRTRRPNQYRLYWAVHDFPKDFPNGVKFHVGTSNVAQDFNYIHWSVFGGKANVLRPDPYYTNVNNWTVTFDATATDLQGKTKATFTIQLAGVKTSAGSTDTATKPFGDLPYTVVLNNRVLPVWTIPAAHSSSCGVRSAATCYTTGNKWTFDASYITAGLNTLVLSLPARATAPEDAVLAESVYVQYDALRMELA